MTSALTKHALEESLKRLLLQKPLNKITVSDITDDCGISRMTFYYHFQDIYDLVEWACQEDAALALAGNKTADTWQTGLLNIFNAVLENKPFIMNVYRCVSRSKIESFLLPAVHDLLMDVMVEHGDTMRVSVEDRDFIVRFFEYSFIGCMLAWIDGGMADDPQKIVDRISTIMDGQMTQALERFASPW